MSESTQVITSNAEQCELPTERICRLERQQRVLVRTIFAIIIVLGVTVTIGMVPGKLHVVEAETLMLTDTAGRIRCLLTAGNDEPCLILTDSKGVKRIRMRIEDDGPKISMYDTRQELRLQMSGADSAPQVVMFDADGVAATRVVGSRTEPQIAILDKEGRSLTKLFVLDGDKAVGSGLSIANDKNGPQILLTTLKDGTTIIRAGNETLAPAPRTKGK